MAFTTVAPRSADAAADRRAGWGDGTTERGSSGAALLDSGGRAVGVLSGGSAQCPDNNGFDFPDVMIHQASNTVTPRGAVTSTPASK